MDVCIECMFTRVRTHTWCVRDEGVPEATQCVNHGVAFVPFTVNTERPLCAGCWGRDMGRASEVPACLERRLVGFVSACGNTLEGTFVGGFLRRTCRQARRLWWKGKRWDEWGEELQGSP